MRFSDRESFAYLLKRGLSLMTNNSEGFNIVHLAVKIEKIEFLSYLMEGTFTSPMIERLSESYSPSKDDQMFDVYGH